MKEIAVHKILLCYFLINDVKPVGAAGNTEPLKTAFAINVKRDAGITEAVRLSNDELAQESLDNYD